MPDLARTAPVLTEVMNMREVRTYEADGASVHVFEMGEGGPAAALWDHSCAGQRIGVVADS